MIDFLFWIPSLIFGLIILFLMVFYYLPKNSRVMKATLIFSSTSFFQKPKPSLKMRLRHIPFILVVLAMICLLLALARPRMGDEQAKDYNQGIAIQMVLDRSGSMTQKHIVINGKKVNYFEAAKKVAKDFILGNEGLLGRPNDLIGFSSFATYVQENCPLTLDHDNLGNIIDFLKSALPKENRTAIGESVYHSVLMLVSLNDYLKNNKDDYSVQSKIIILLTDGENNWGRDLTTAARFAKKNKIRIYPIFLGNRGFKRALENGHPVAVQVIQGLRHLANETQGKFQLAFDNESLIQVYKEIDKLEKSNIKESYFRYRELFQYLLIAAFVLLLLEIILSETVFRRIP